MLGTGASVMSNSPEREERTRLADKGIGGGSSHGGERGQATQKSKGVGRGGGGGGDGGGWEDLARGEVIWMDTHSGLVPPDSQIVRFISSLPRPTSSDTNPR